MAAVAACLVGDSLTVFLAAIESRIHMEGWRDGYFLEPKHGANRARTSASSTSSKHFSSETRRSSTGGENDDRHSSTKAEPASLLGPKDPTPSV